MADTLELVIITGMSGAGKTVETQFSGVGESTAPEPGEPAPGDPDPNPGEGDDDGNEGSDGAILDTPVTINNGHVMRAWYDIRHADLAQREDEAGLRASQERVAALVAREIERGIPSERIVLMGFSQGCAMTLLAGLRQPHRLAGPLRIRPAKT